ncbi:MAG: universal stress protein [Desulfobacterales bacterium]
MIKLLVYTDGKPAAGGALHFAAALKKRLGAELTVITIRSGTHATEEPPPLGTDVPLENRPVLPRGLQILIDAAAILAQEGLLEPLTHITIRDVSNGHLFVGKTPSGERIAFLESFGPFIESLNREIDQNGHNLLVVSPPRRTGLRRLVAGNTTRKLALDLHTSVLVVRGGGPDSRFVVCADGSTSARRQFPLLKLLLRAIRNQVDLICVKKPHDSEETARAATECLQHARNWLENCDKNGRLHLLEGDDPAELIVETAGGDAVIVMGASLRHDVYRRMLGSLPMQVLAQTDASVLLVKLPPEADSDFFKDPFTC